MVNAAVLTHCGKKLSSEIDARIFVRETIQRIEVLPTALKVTIKATQLEADDQVNDLTETLTIPWVKPSSIRKREILGQHDQSVSRPIRTEALSRHYAPGRCQQLGTKVSTARQET